MSCGASCCRCANRNRPMTPEVTAIIPTYNRREMVVEAIASVLAQRNATFELIVVDDGSTDYSAAAIDAALEEAEAPVRVIQTENRGAAAARNIAVEAAQAPLIAFLDSDDLWHPDKLARQVAFMGENPSIEISQCNEIWIRDGRRVNPGIRHYKRSGDIFNDSLRTCLISPSAAIMKTKLFRDLDGFDETMDAAEDYDLWLRVLMNHQAGLLDENLVTRRAGHGDQLSTRTLAIDRFRILALLKLLANPALEGVRRTETSEALAEKCQIYAKGSERRGRNAAFYRKMAEKAQNEWVRGPHESLPETIAEMRALLRERSRPGEYDGG